MGTRGPQPKPRAIRELEGITKPSHYNQSEPLPKVSTIEPPIELTPQQRLIWDALAPELIRIGTLTIIDFPAFLRYINYSIEYNEMQRQIDNKNYIMIYRDEKGKARHVQILPQVTLRDRAAKHLLQLESHFGMTPASRTRVSAILGGAYVPVPERIADPLELDSD